MRAETGRTKLELFRRDDFDVMAAGLSDGQPVEGKALRSPAKTFSSLRD